MTENYEVLGQLGEGSFGSVFKIRQKSDGRILVWKQLHFSEMKEKEKQLLVQEVNILQKLRHQHIVKYYDRIIDRESGVLYIIMEYCSCGDLAGLIKKCKAERTFVEEEVIWKVLLQILLALQDCHKRKDGIILHRDIKPGNIFLDQNRNVKLGDFGLARVLSNDSLFAHTYVGTPYYMSPEQTTGLAYNEKCDIWSLGCVIYELAALVPPFQAQKAVELSAKIKLGRFSRIPPQYSEELYQTICQMLNVNRIKRPSVDELLAIPKIAVLNRERKIQAHYLTLKKKEEDLEQKEKELQQKEALLNAREKSIEEREKRLMLRGSGDYPVPQSRGDLKVLGERMSNIPSMGGVTTRKVVDTMRDRINDENAVNQVTTTIPNIRLSTGM
eukprot:TRINITY_DN75_c0_g1_i2.p1 TRINITY_DN75_c0_g1~~TRINITY_DN75_c0_g1_i2.p1  ORF type:complete len:448 (+),score=93.70 TRINITY_DN75_c0_g1_i2:188-1345(+)